MKLFKRRPVEPEPQGEGDHIEGERGPPSIARAPSLQSRVSNVLAIGLMSVLGVGMLVWYYARTFSAPARERDHTASAARAQAHGEVNLPPIGPVDPPVSTMSLLGPPSDPLPPEGVSNVWPPPASAARPAYVAPVPPTQSPEALALARKLSGPVMANNAGTGTSAGAFTDAALEGDSLMKAPGPGAADEGPMASLLKPSVTPAARARVLPTQRLLLPKGAFLDCTLETAIDSTLPGMTTCVTATDTFSVDGAVVLMERGTKLIGETRGQVQQGASRLFVLWTEARTPTGVVIPLASPGTDELGRSGLPGTVNRHFFERFGAAILISVIDGAIQREVQADAEGAVIYDPSSSQDIATEVLKSTINIPPTVTKRHGDRIQVLVARDLDFRSVYELRPAAAGR